MPRIVRGQVALEVGDRLRDLGRKLLNIDQYSGDARESQLSSIAGALQGEIGRMDLIIRSCRGAKNSYPNYPALRKVIADAGDEVYDIQQETQALLDVLRSDTHEAGVSLLTLGQKVKLVSFVPPSREVSQA